MPNSSPRGPLENRESPEINEIITHFNVDLDAASSTWAAKKFIPGAASASLSFKSASWKDEVADDQLVVDMDAGGQGLKGKKDPDGIVHSCFASIIEEHGSEEDKKALEKLVAYIDAQDAHGNAVNYLAPEASKEARDILSASGINSVLRALQARNPRNDQVVCEKFSEILDGLHQAGVSRLRAEKEAERAEIMPGEEVAIVTNSKEFATNGILFERGVRVIVYVDGNNLGVIRHGEETLRMDHDDLKEIVSVYGEEEEWFAHPAGFLFCRGSRKAPAKDVSKVDPRSLAETAARLLVARKLEQ